MQFVNTGKVVLKCKEIQNVCKCLGVFNGLSCLLDEIKKKVFLMQTIMNYSNPISKYPKTCYSAWSLTTWADAMFS